MQLSRPPKNIKSEVVHMSKESLIEAKGLNKEYIPSASTNENNKGYADCAATSHLVTTKFEGTPIEHEPVTFNCANKTQMTSIGAVEMNLQGVEPENKIGHVCKELDYNLFSLGKLAKDGCKSELSNEKIDITKGDKRIIEGPRAQIDDLWELTA